MKNIIIIRILALILCSAIVGEMTVLVGKGDTISAETDTELGHEKGNEKAKTTRGFESLLLAENSIIPQIALTAYKNPSWNSPPIDFRTPPPELT